MAAASPSSTRLTNLRKLPCLSYRLARKLWVNPAIPARSKDGSMSEAAADQKIAVVGAGAWGTALAVLFCAAGKPTTLVVRDAARAAGLTAWRENARLPGIMLPDKLT